MVEIEVDYGKLFELDPTSENKLMCMGETMVKYVLNLQIVFTSI